MDNVLQINVELYNGVHHILALGERILQTTSYIVNALAFLILGKCLILFINSMIKDGKRRRSLCALYKNIYILSRLLKC